mmetsp:Transcript_30781/g.80546  ORF Transcript_30781/g.80546 Transcript_30781/m.80546 type:complete len:1703 (+) Transcript_30781:130-5238(+)
MAGAPVKWGEYMGAWKTLDEENERLTRAAAAIGAEAMAKLKDLNILVVGCRGTGVETAKNLILSNVGAVVVHDPHPACIADRGANFYLTDADVAARTPRAVACLKELKSLNPYCKVDAWEGPLTAEAVVADKNVLGSGKPFTAIIVTELLPKEELFELNEAARAAGMAFVLAVTSGVTASVFSDFGPAHHITDPNGEPMQPLALSSCEVLARPDVLKVDGVKAGQAVAILTFAGETGPGSIADITNLGTSVVELDDCSGPLAALNGRKFKVERVFFVSPAAAKVDTSDGLYKEMLNSGAAECVTHWAKQYDTYKAEFEAEPNADGDKKKFKTREILVMNMLAIVATAEQDADAGPAIFKFGAVDAALFKGFTAGGLVNPVKEAVQKSFTSLEASLEGVANPQMLVQEGWANGDGVDVHLALSATLEFQAQKGRWPARASQADAADVVALAQKISDDRAEQAKGDGAPPKCWAQKFSWGFPTGEARPVDEGRVGRYASLFGTELTGFCAYLGGVAAQEVMKRTGKYLPISGWIHHEDQALTIDAAPSNTAPLGTRYDHQVAILGKDFQSRAANQKVFLVGCGALGCEYLKGLAMMGVGVGADGKVIVTDMDTIEMSNLSRQFLFRGSDLGQPKSVTGARVVKKWNPAMNVEGIEYRVGAGTEQAGKEEQKFTDEFWAELDLCWNALDNVKARQYTDTCCARYAKPLLESGTLGTKSNSDVYLPYRTKTYNDAEEAEENQIAMCTLKGAPYLPLHCIEYAKQAMFSDQFEFYPAQYEDFRTNSAGFFSGLADMSTESERIKALEGVKFFVDLQKDGPITFEGCIKTAFGQLVKYFREDVLEIQHKGDTLEKAGKKEWTGVKRRPQPVEWSTDDARSMEFLYTASNLYAFTFGIDYVKDRAEFEAIVQTLDLRQPQWSPPAPADGDHAEAAAADGDEPDADPSLTAKLKDELGRMDVKALQPAVEHDFEKDDDSNFHVDYLTIATNLRAWNFQIKETPRASVKVTAGKIMPALATTTAMVCGLVDIEFCKLVLGLQNLGRQKFLYSNINLALGSEAFNGFEPEGPSVLETGLECLPKFTVWDTVVIDEGDLTGSGLAEALERRLPGLRVDELRAVGGSGALPGETIRRIKKELADLTEDPIPGVALNEGADGSADISVVHARVQGPPDTPYAGGTILVEIKLPAKYPTSAPAVRAVTPIYHCNFHESGEPCPVLVFGGGWSPRSGLRTILMQIVQLLKEPVPKAALRADLGALAVANPELYAAEVKKHTALHATAEQAFAPQRGGVAALYTRGGDDDSETIAASFVKQRANAFSEKQRKKGGAGAPLAPYPHGYIFVEGDFAATADGGDVQLPRIKVVLPGLGSAAPAGRAMAAGTVAAAAAEMSADEIRAAIIELSQRLGQLDGEAAAAPPAPADAPPSKVQMVDAELLAKVKGLELELDGEGLTVNGCYHLQPERGAIYSTIPGEDGTPLFPELAEGGIAATCVTDSGEVVETILTSGLKHCTVPDVMFMVDELALTQLPEAQFVGGGPWIAAATGTTTVEMERENVFALYEKNVTQLPPDCISALRRMLQDGPICKLYAQGHERGLRMAEADLEKYQTVNDKGKVTNVPRVSLGVRVWNPVTRKYDVLDNDLKSAPNSEKAAEAWFCSVIAKLKGSPYLGPENVDAMITGTGQEYSADGTLVMLGAGSFKNKWTELALSVKL